MKKVAMLIAVSLTLSSCSIIADALLEWQLKHADNQAEEFIEDLIEDQTDCDIDLTPITGQEKQSLNSKVN